MGGISTVHFKAFEKSSFPVGMYLDDIPLEVINVTINGKAKDIATYVNALLGSNTWQKLPFYCPRALFRPEGEDEYYSPPGKDGLYTPSLNDLKILCPGLRFLPDDYMPVLPPDDGTIKLDNLFCDVYGDFRQTTQCIRDESNSPNWGLYVAANPNDNTAVLYQSYFNFRNAFNFIVYPTSLIKNGKFNLGPYLQDGSSRGRAKLPDIAWRVGLYIYYDRSKYTIRSAQITTSPIEYAYFTDEDNYNFWTGAGDVPGGGSDNPYSPGGTSGGGGGGGSFDGSSDPVDLPAPPTIQAVDSGFITLYSPTVTQLQGLANYMWSDSFSINDFKKLFADPMSAIIGLNVVPVTVPKSPARTVKIGNIDTGALMFPASSQWVTVNCGSVTLPEYWGAYLDYNPYTALQLYLPYIGTHTVSADDVIGKPLTLQYNVDILSGACVASLKCGDSVLYNWQGACGMEIPFTSNSYTNLLSSILQVAGGGIALASASTPGAVAMATLTATSGVANAQKNNISHGGGISGAGGFMNIQTPYFILSRPSLCLPEGQNTYLGYPSFVTVELSKVTGYTKVEEIHLTNIPATESELQELYSLLKEGVIF